MNNEAMARSLPVPALLLLLLSLPGTAQVPGSVPSYLQGSQSLFPVRIGDLWGYIDRTGMVRIYPQFTSALDFGPNNEPAPVQVGELWGLIDTRGRWVRKPVGSHMRMDLNGDGSIFYHYYDTAARKQRFMDAEGKSTERLNGELTQGSRPDRKNVEIPPAVRALTYDEILPFLPDRFIITRIGHIYSESQIVNGEGKYLLPSWMRKGRKTKEGYIVFQALRNGGGALLDSTGRILYDSTWRSIQPASSHLFVVGISKNAGRYNREKRFGLMSPDGTFLIPPTAKDLRPVEGQDSLFLTSITVCSMIMSKVSMGRRPCVFAASPARFSYRPTLSYPDPELSDPISARV